MLQILSELLIVFFKAKSYILLANKWYVLFLDGSPKVYFDHQWHILMGKGNTQLVILLYLKKILICPLRGGGAKGLRGFQGGCPNVYDELFFLFIPSLFNLFKNIIRYALIYISLPDYIFIIIHNFLIWKKNIN